MRAFEPVRKRVPKSAHEEATALIRGHIKLHDRLATGRVSPGPAEVIS
jgi:hypothetical protein